MTSRDSTPDKPLTLAWLRRDLRLHDHAALNEALKGEGAVQPVFVFDTDILKRFDDKRDKRLTFLAHICCHLHKELKKRGGGLLVLHGSAREVMPRLCEVMHTSRLVAARDVEPGPRERDRHVFKAVEGKTEMVSVVDHLLLWPDRVVKEDGSPFQVFTPYSKRFRSAVTKEDLVERVVKDRGRYADYTFVQEKVRAGKLPVISCDEGPEALLKSIGYEEVPLGEWGVADTQKRLDMFLDQVKNYKEARNFPAEEGTSKLSPYLRFGLISIRECARAVWDLGGVGAETWAKELIWREFYATILYHFPHVVTEDFQERYRGKLAWENDEKKFLRWCEGQTGFPFIDAAMRQLNETGWMHNRARMVVASFMTKDLRVDWRRGEEYFAQKLMDYDLASNNGGWQWCASTGTDAQPWFRIFNPVLQSKKFDPQGAYIHRFVPELKELKGDVLHEPWKSKEGFSYVSPVVEHSAEREKTLAMFKAVR